jgi:hypothetical protein
MNSLRVNLRAVALVEAQRLHHVERGARGEHIRRRKGRPALESGKS